MNKDLIKFTLISFMLLNLFCSGGSELSGGSNQTDNAKVQVSAVYPDGEYAEGALVIIRKEDFIASEEFDSTNTGYTNSDGIFISETLDTGTYFAEIKDPLNNSSIIKFSISDTTDTLKLPQNTLILPGSIEGSLNTDGYSGVISIIGTEHITKVDSLGLFSFTNIPAYSNYNLRFKSKNIDASVQIIDSVKVISDSTVGLFLQTNWKYEKKIIINTTSSGASISESVSNFPLLIHISGNTDFNFDQAKSNGEDIRFFDMNNKRLHFEIESYSNSLNDAILWVLVPLIEANNDSQYITMKWGNENALFDSAYSEVFSDANNYKGVWHFNDSFNDATNLENNGTAIGSAQIDNNGHIGKSLHIYSNNSYIQIENEPYFDITNEVSISAWVKPDSLSKFTWNDAILSKGSDAYSLSRAIGKDVMAMTSLPDGKNSNISADGFTQLNDLQLHFITGIKRGDSLFIYADGVKEGSYYHPEKITLNDHPLLIGAKDTNSTPIDVFHGMIDEVRISNVGRSDSWIKLSYENQKINSTVLTFQ